MIIELLMKTGFDEMETLLICQLGTFRTGAVGSWWMDSAVLSVMKKNGRETWDGQCLQERGTLNFKVNNS